MQAYGFDVRGRPLRAWLLDLVGGVTTYRLPHTSLHWCLAPQQQSCVHCPHLAKQKANASFNSDARLKSFAVGGETTNLRHAISTIDRFAPEGNEHDS